MHDTDFLHEHGALSDSDKLEIARYIWGQESVELRTVGIDIGSSTSHLLFAKVTLQRQTQSLSSRFVPISREIVWRSPIEFTPFLPDGTIDAGALGTFITQCYAHSGHTREQIDCGAVILTGEAVKKTNARAIDELFAGEAGKFVCATAGHKLEATLAAHGSGAVRLSKERAACLLHVDIGGGTTKLAFIENGTILAVSAVAVGGRLIAETEGMWSRVAEPAKLVARDLGIATDPRTLSDPDARARIAARLATLAADAILQTALDDLGRALQLTEPLAPSAAPQLITFSGGVAEYLFGHETRVYGDIAGLLANALGRELAQRTKLRLVDPGQRIRATVIGASQFTMQVSGKTIWLPNPAVLPIRNVPVVRFDGVLEAAIDDATVPAAIRAKLERLDLDPAARIAVAFTWQGDPEYTRLRNMARAIVGAVAPDRTRKELLLLMIDGDIGRSLGHIVEHELETPGKVVAIDGVELQDFDYVDIGAMITPPGVVPVVIKSLLFA